MRVLVVGAGATGGYFGGRLAEAGRDVTFLVRPARAERLRADGLRIVSQHGDLTLTPRLVTAGALTRAYDVVLLAVKAYALEGAVADLAPAVGPETMVLPLLNGMRHVGSLVDRFGEEAVLGGLCVVAGTLDGAGRIVQLAGIQELTYGDRHHPDSPRLAALDATLRGANFTARLSTRIELEMWEKWVMLAALGAMTCLMRGTVGQIEAAPGGREFAEQLLAECAAVAAACGHPVRESTFERIRTTMTEPGSRFAASMYRDLLQGNEVEVDHIVGDLLDRGRAGGVPMPLLSLVFTHLRVYQQSRTA